MADKPEHSFPYLAGIMDGEGCFFAGWTRDNSKKSRPLVARIQLAMADEAPVLLFNECFGGRLKRFKTKNGRPILECRLTNSKEIMFCVESLNPYLMGKKKQAQILHSLCFVRSRVRELNPNSSVYKANRTSVTRFYHSCVTKLKSLKAVPSHG